jgi:hypothetical protein
MIGLTLHAWRTIALLGTSAGPEFMQSVEALQIGRIESKEIRFFGGFYDQRVL